MKIRNYNVNDIKTITNLGRYLHNNYEFSLDTFSNCIVCESDCQIIGFVSYSIIYERAEIIDIIIEENYRGLGLGLALMNKVVDECTVKNVDNITLEVNEDNKNAIKFYQNLGFKKVAVRPNYYDKGNKDAYIMQKKLR